MNKSIFCYIFYILRKFTPFMELMKSGVAQNFAQYF